MVGWGAPAPYSSGYDRGNDDGYQGGYDKCCGGGYDGGCKRGYGEDYAGGNKGGCGGGYKSSGGGYDGGYGGGYGGGYSTASQGQQYGSHQQREQSDWICPNANCRDVCFGRNMACRKCGMPKDGEVSKQFKAGDWHCPSCGDHQFARNAQCKKCGEEKPAGINSAVASIDDSTTKFCQAGQIVGRQTAKEGDWMCQNPACGDLCFAKTFACRKCGFPRNGQKSERFKPGDWNCPSCGDHQFMKNPECKKCGGPKPQHVCSSAFGSGAVGANVTVCEEGQVVGGKTAKAGDWICPNAMCGDLVFAKNMACRKCGTPKAGESPDNFKEGDWHCPSCGDHQFARNHVCKRCGGQKPAAIAAREGILGGCKGLSTGHCVIVNGQVMMAVPQAIAKQMGGCSGAIPVGGSAMPGDWSCPSCGDHQFSRNTMCRKCHALKPGDSHTPARGGHSAGGQSHSAHGGERMGGGASSGGKLGDWSCPGCGDHQFSRNQECRKCCTPKPEVGGGYGGGGDGGGGGMKDGDWTCPGCGDHQFARNASCRKCSPPKPDGCGGGGGYGGRGGGMKPGDWACRGCGDHQFARNTICRKCGSPKPEEDYYPDPKRLRNE